MKRNLLLLACVIVSFGFAQAEAGGQGTKLWTVDRYDELERGSTDGVAIRSDGTIGAASPASLLYTSSGNYVWSVAADSAGNAYAGLGGTISGSAAVMRVGLDGKATKVFFRKRACGPGGEGEPGWLALRRNFFPMARSTAWRRKVERQRSSSTLRPRRRNRSTFGILRLGAGGEIYVAAGAPARGLSRGKGRRQAGVGIQNSRPAYAGVFCWIRRECYGPERMAAESSIVSILV